ncbi:hypothetical protein [Methylovorus glucosotrophus]|uniref:Uncharacterized protein n=1 Tax=Methylovorus glucosotrophus (strain SIP3-4) TaxID=582744 RepID=C6X7W5_METGS|nr:hypothetical protein [Methylovorus glucosotrophus]ACT51292.1 hypothetical protein Msip34_2050 [Methylovorus glucosotrophus SIP3-4]
MYDDDLDKILDKVIDEREKVVSLSNKKLSEIFRKHYPKFKKIQLSYKGGFGDVNKEFGTYTKQIQSVLTSVGKFQFDGSPISEYQIINEMYKESKRRASIESPTPIIDNETSFKAPTTDFHSSGVVKVSTKNNKKVVAPTSGIVEPTKIENMAKAIHILKSEIIQYKQDSIIPVWNSNDEFMHMKYQEIASTNNLKINDFSFIDVLPRFPTEEREYYERWKTKAFICEKLYK